MTLHPPAVLWPDVQTVVPAILRTALATDPPTYAKGVHVGARRLPSWPAPVVVVRRDGGMVSGVHDVARVSVRVWHTHPDDASDLALLVRTVLLNVRGRSDVVRVRHLSGPMDVTSPDETETQNLALFEATLRGEVWQP